MPVADEKARKVIAEDLTIGKIPTVSAHASSITGLSITELILAYNAHAATYYVKEGAPTKEVSIIRDTLKVLRELYGTTRAAVTERPGTREGHLDFG